LLKRKPDTHKGSYGHVLVLGGSTGLTGAVCLCANSALKMGAGLVTAGVPVSLNSIFEIKLTEVMTLPLADYEGGLCLESFSRIEEFLPKVDVLVIGPGASVGPNTQKLMVKIIEQVDKPVVADADAITALAANLDALGRKKTKEIILTPHLGEFSRLIDLDKNQINKKRKELVKDFALRYNLTLVLKGNRTLVSDGKNIFENKTGNPGLATAGTGDVLSGMIAGLLAQGLSVYEAAKYGVYLHGLAGDLAVKEKTQNCLIASDIINYLPKAMKK